MEAITKYWWVGAGLIALLLLTRGSSRATGPTITQIGGGQEGLAYAQLDSQTALAEKAANFSFVNSLLGFGLEADRTERTDQLERLRIAANERTAVATAQYQNSANIAALNAANYNARLQNEAQLAAIRAQRSGQSQTNWLNAIFGGFDRVAPLIFGGGNNSSGGGVFGTPPFNGGNWSGGFSWGGW